MFERLKKTILLESNRLTYIPKWLSEQSMLMAFVALGIVFALWPGRAMPTYMYFLYVLEIVGFFYYSNLLSKKWAVCDTKRFVKHVFTTGFLIRLVWVLLFNIGDILNMEIGTSKVAGDAAWYLSAGYYEGMGSIYQGDFNLVAMWLSYGIEIADMGYPIYLAILYSLTGGISQLVVPLVLKAAYGAYTAVLIYHIAQRHFGESVARMAAVLCMLNPYLIYYSGMMLKETEMVFLLCLFVNQMDAVLQKGRITLLAVIPPSLVGLYLMMFRSALGVVCFLAVFATIVLASTRLVSFQKKVVAGILVAAVVAIGFGGEMVSTVNELTENAGGELQQKNMEWRSHRTHGNEFAKYAGAAVFAPLIFTIPFPTMAYTHEGQTILMHLAGGSLIKNVLSFFVIWSMLCLLFSGTWRQHVLPISLLLGYLLVLVMSVYAQSGRFHVPAMPFEMLFAAYGISLSNKMSIKRSYGLWLLAMVVVCVGWQWFKLRGQGLI